MSAGLPGDVLVVILLAAVGRRVACPAIDQACEPAVHLRELVRVPARLSV